MSSRGSKGLAESTILVVTEPKTARSKRVDPLSTPAVQLLRELRATQSEERQSAGSAWRETGYVFTTEFGEPCDPRNALRALKAAAAREGFPGTGLHGLRHSAASVMLTHGVPLEVVSEILGHSSVAITRDVYGHVAPDVARETVATLGAAFGNQGRPQGGQTTPDSRQGRFRIPPEPPLTCGFSLSG